MRERAVLLCAGALLLAAGPVAAEDAGAWLVKASNAARTSSYRGVVVYRDERMMEVLRLVHRQHDGRVQERLTSLTGKPRDLLREGDDVACMTAGEPVQSAGGIPQNLFPVMSAELLARASAHYQVRDLGQARVAGRTCRGVAMTPRDDYRYGYEICADVEHAVPLRVSLLNRQGQAVEQLMFTQVEFPATIGDEAFAAPAVARREGPARDRGAAIAASGTSGGWQLAQLPPGFRIILRSRGDGPGGAGSVEHVLLSDGVSAVSVFGAPAAPSAQPISGLSQMGAMNAYGRSVGTLHVTVVGEVPPATVRLIGEGFTAGPAAR